jgi:hypothetical protein
MDAKLLQQLIDTGAVTGVDGLPPDPTKLTAREIRAIEREVSMLMAATTAKFYEEGAAAGQVLLRGVNAVHQARRTQRREIAAEILSFWGTPLAILDGLIQASVDAGALELSRWRNRRVSTDVHLRGCLYRLLARACQVASEIVVLLESGFAAGALARWRSLHEIDVVCALLIDGGEPRATRYLEHRAVLQWKLAKEHNQHCKALRMRPISAKRFARAQKLKDDLLAKYGTHFAKDYGWVSGPGTPAITNFADAERSVGYDSARPVYKFASDPVHANAGGILSSIQSKGRRAPLLAGPSVYGLADPLTRTVNTQMRIAAKVLSLRDTKKNVIKCVALQEFSKAALEACEEAVRRQQDAERSVRRARSRHGRRPNAQWR